MRICTAGTTFGARGICTGGSTFAAAPDRLHGVLQDARRSSVAWKETGVFFLSNSRSSSLSRVATLTLCTGAPRTVQHWLNVCSPRHQVVGGMFRWLLAGLLNFEQSGRCQCRVVT